MFLTMLGLPLNDLPSLPAMKDGIIRPHEIVGKPLGQPGTDAHQAATAASIYEYFTQIMEEHKLDPRDHMLNWFLEAEIDGDRLTGKEILDICFLFLIAGLDTVSASLDCFFSYLAQHPQLRRAIAGDQSSIPFVVEELLRWETPVMAVAREAKRDTELDGCPIHVGEQVLAMLGSANTDENNTPERNDCTARSAHSSSPSSSSETSSTAPFLRPT